MPQKKQKKIETEITEIVIVNNKKLTPYIELVNFSSKNIDQKKLGTILGIFEIKDLSDDSAYIVNFLASVAKKTYFASHQKNSEESFESTLAKVNLSLSEIAKHGNVSWIGKIDAVLCSISENQINFSVSGDAKVLLMRNQKMTEISSNLSPKDEAINPLKTFTDIASGKLALGDKLILTTDDISHIFTVEDLEKHALSFSNKKFARFLKTALVNELDIAGTLVIDTKEVISEVKNKITKEVVSKVKNEVNVFGSSAFGNKTKITNQSIKNEHLESVIEKEDSIEYTNKKTGHIYITDPNGDYQNLSENKFDEWMEASKEKFSDFNFWFKEKYLKKGEYEIKKRISSLFEKKDKETEQVIIIQKEENSKSYLEHFSNLSQKTKNAILETSQNTKTIISKYSPTPKNFIKINSPTNIPVASPLKKRLDLSTYHSKFKKINFNKISSFITIIFSKLKMVIIFLISITLPKFSKAKSIFLKMNTKLKIIILLIILAIIIIPFFLLSREKDNISTSNSSPTNTSAQNNTINPSAQSHKEAISLYSDEEIIGTFVFNNTVFAISKNKITDVTNAKKEYLFPNNFKNAKLYSFMGDLRLLFLINESNQLISFSPISLKFKDETIAINSEAEIEAIKSYLTYLYIVDTKNKQIYRYPRAENGFGEKTDWLQSDINFENITGMAIDGNVYLSKKDSVIKLFNRKTLSFELKKDANSSINDIFTDDDVSSIYVLDNMNGELNKYDKEGNKQSFISSQELTRAKRVWVDEKNSIAYFNTNDGLFKINISE